MLYFSRTTNGFYSDDVHTSIPSDAVKLSSEQHVDLMRGQSAGKQIVADKNGFPILQELPRTRAEILAEHTAAVQARLDQFAQTRGYDGILSACSYASSTNAKFASEGQYCVTARDNTWATCYAIMAEVEAGKRPMPTLDEIMAELPALTWAT